MFTFSKSVNAGRTVYDFNRVLELADAIELRGYKGPALEAVTLPTIPTDAETLSCVLLRLVTAHVQTLTAKANGKPVMLPVPGLNENKEGSKLTRKEEDAGRVLARLTAMSDEDTSRGTEGAILAGGNTRGLALLYREACGLTKIDAPVVVTDCASLADAQDISIRSNRQGKAADTRAVLSYLLTKTPRLGRAEVMADLGCTAGKAQEYVAAVESFSFRPALFDDFGGYTFNYKVHNLAKAAGSLAEARQVYESKAPEKLNRNEEVGKIFLAAIPDCALHKYLSLVYAKDTTAETDLSEVRQAAIAWILAQCA